jgi:hypothetical protein
MRRLRRRHRAVSATERILGGAAKRAPATPVGGGLTDPIVGPGPAALIQEGIGEAGRVSTGRCQALLERMVAAIAPKRVRAPWIAILGRAVILRMSRRSERERNRNECKPHAGSIRRRRYLFPEDGTNPGCRRPGIFLKLTRSGIPALMRWFMRRHRAVSPMAQILAGAAKRAPAAPMAREATDRNVGFGPGALIEEGIGVAGPLSAGLCQALLERVVAAIAPSRVRAPWIAILG